MSKFQSSLRAGAAAIALGVGAFCLTSPALAQVAIVLPPSSLEESLNGLSRQSGVQILVDQTLLRGKRAPAINGASSPEAALNQLLRASGLTYQKRGNAFLVVHDGGGSRPAPTPEPRRTSSAPTNNDLETSALEEIVVTGTRISRTGYSAPVPLTVVGREEIGTSGSSSIIDTLRESAAIANGLDNSNSYNNLEGGAAFINLRGLGTNRSLVLVNGRRRVSGSASSSAVDVNTIPAAMIDRVEITTGGSSAIYGADAVSGVVNIMTRKNFDGVEMDINGGVSSRGDAKRYSLNVFGGSQLSDDRGYVNFGVSYNAEDPLAYNDRSYLKHTLTRQINPDNTGASDGIPNTLTYKDVYSTQSSPYATIYVNNTHYVYGPNGLANQTPRIRISSGSLASGIDFPADSGSLEDMNYGQYTVVMDSKVFSGRGDISYNVTDNVRFFVEGEFSQTKTAVVNQFYRFDERSTWWPESSIPGELRVTTGNYYMPTSVASLLRENGLTSVGIRKRMKYELGVITDHHTRNTHSLVAGFDGAIFDTWKWDVSYQYGDVKDDILTPNLLRVARFKNAADVIADPATGLPVCRDAAARAAGCAPYNIWGAVALSQAQADYMVGARQQFTRNTQKIFAAHLNGDLFNLPAGAVTLAGGVEHREEGLQTRDDDAMIDGSIRWGVGTNATPRPTLDETFKVTEQYGEILAPVLKDLPFIAALDVNAAVRASNYSTIGKTIAWQVGANWKVNDDIKLRFTRSKSVRAPNLFELYGPTIITGTSIDNPCGPSTIDTTPNRRNNCTSLGNPANGGVRLIPHIDIISGGTLDAREETSKSLTLGAIITPGLIPNFSLSLDYFRIDIDDALTSFGSTAMLRGCLDSSSMSGNMFCENMAFDSAGSLTTLKQVLINASEFTTSGVDFAADYRIPVGGAGRLGVSLAGTYLINKKFVGISGDSATLDLQAGEYTAPKLRANLAVRYDRSNWGVSVTNRFIGKSIIDKQAVKEAIDINSVTAKIYTDAVLRLDIRDGWSGYVGVNNVLGVKPPQTAETYRYGAHYDLIGRYFHMGIKAKF